MQFIRRQLPSYWPLRCARCPSPLRGSGARSPCAGGSPSGGSTAKLRPPPTRPGGGRVRASRCWVALDRLHVKAKPCGRAARGLDMKPASRLNGTMGRVPPMGDSPRAERWCLSWGLWFSLGLAAAVWLACRCRLLRGLLRGVAVVCSRLARCCGLRGVRSRSGRCSCRRRRAVLRLLPSRCGASLLLAGVFLVGGRDSGPQRKEGRSVIFPLISLSLQHACL